MAGIFISYRRDDAAPWAGRLYERLAREFPRQMLMDVDAIEPGLDFVKVLDEQVSSCDVMLVLIGPAWMEAKNERGVRRLDDPDDFVCVEISSALKRDIRVIPVLVEGANMPRADDLPEPLKPLARRHAVQVSHVRFNADTQGLVEVLQRITRPAVPERRGLFGRMAKPAAPVPKSPTPAAQPALEAGLQHSVSAPTAKAAVGVRPDAPASRRSEISLAAIFVLTGALAISFPIMGWPGTSSSSVWPIVFAIAGLAQIGHAFWARARSGYLIGALYLTAAVLLWFNLTTGVIARLFFLAVVIFIDGAIRSVVAFRLRPTPGWIWLLIGGVVSIILSIMIWQGLPYRGTLILGYQLGAHFVFSGLSFLMLASSNTKARITSL